MSSVKYLEILRQYWGYDQFRGIQADIIESIGSGRDTLGLMPTGGGKSITFQVPAMAADGVCLVITPLIALMKDQVLNLRARGIRADAIYSGISRSRIVEIMEDCIFGGCKFLYVSPERLSSELFQTKLRHMKVSIITVDEAHCISQWGYDFRPAYLEISKIRELLPGVPVLALTATATPRVAEDIMRQLEFKDGQMFRMSFSRSNLWYMVRNTDNKYKELTYILSRVDGCGIVYVRNRRDTKEIAELLRKDGITAEYYHAGLDQHVKDERQKRWTEGSSRIMVATNAFGMGIDKPDVRTVIHMDVPDSPEAYFQEAGRGGRDGRTSYAVLLYSPGDKRILSKRVSDSYPEKDFIRKVYDKLSYMHNMAVGDGRGCTFSFSLTEFCSGYSLPAVQTDSALRILTRMGYIEYIDEADYSARLQFTTTRENLYDIRSGSPETEKILNTILRTYSGVFSEQVFLDEYLICQKAGIDHRTLYDTLTGLSRMGTVHYIPSVRTPLIVWKRERVDSSMLNFPDEIYKERKEEYQARIKAMTEYATRTAGCRTEMLLNYFGEKMQEPCMRCDLCQERHDSGVSRGMYRKIHDDVVRVIRDGSKPQDLIYALPHDRKKIDQVLEHMFAEEELYVSDGTIRITGNAQ